MRRVVLLGLLILSACRPGTQLDLATQWEKQKVVGISSDSTDDANTTRDKLGLNFELYSDPQLAEISQWGVEDVGANIARLAAFVVAPGGMITYRRIAKSPADQPSIAELITALERN